MGKEQCDVTWEPAENVPAVVVAEFESGAQTVSKDSIVAGVGQRMHTLTVEKASSQLHPDQRKVVKNNEGCVKIFDSIKSLNCVLLVVEHLLASHKILQDCNAILRRTRKDSTTALQVLKYTRL